MNANYKVKPEDFNGLDISSLPDQPSLTAAELKARFDAPAKVVLSGKINQIVDALNSTTAGSSGASQIGSAPVNGVNNPDGKSATVIHDQISALQRNIVAVVNKDLPEGSFNGSKIIDGTVSTDKLRDINIGKVPSYIELPIAPGENLKTPCVVTLGKNGVEIPKLSCFSGPKNIWADNVFRSGDGTLYNPIINHLYSNYAVISYCRYIAANTYEPTVAVGTIENNHFIPFATIMTLPTVTTTVQIPFYSWKLNDGNCIIGVCDDLRFNIHIYAFRLENSTYNEICRYVDTDAGGATGERLTLFSDNRLILKNYIAATTENPPLNKGTHMKIIKFTGTEFIPYASNMITASSFDHPVTRLTDTRFVTQYSSIHVYVYDVIDNNVTFHSSKSIAGIIMQAISPITENRYALYYMQSGILYGTVYEIGSDKVHREIMSKTLFQVSNNISFQRLTSQYMHHTYLSTAYGSGGVKQVSTIFKQSPDNLEVYKTTPWPFLNVGTSMCDQTVPRQQSIKPYTLAASAYSALGSSTMKYGLVEYGSFIEPPEWMGMAVSQENGKARVLVDNGVVTGFSGLSAGVEYSLSYEGGLCDIKNHPMAIKVGTAIDDKTLLFTGGKG